MAGFDYNDLMTPEERRERGLKEHEKEAEVEVPFDLAEYQARAIGRAATAANPIITLQRADGTEIGVLAAKLALEIALYGDDLATLADTYGVHIRQLRRAIDSNPMLAHEIVEAQKEMKKTSRLRMRMRDGLESYSYVLAEILANPASPPAVQVSAYTLMARLAGVLDTKDDGIDKRPPVIINITGLKDAGLDIKPIQSDVQATELLELQDGTYGTEE